MGAWIVRYQSGVVDGVRVSRQYRLGDGVAFGLRGLDVFAQSACSGWIIFRAQLPDQNRSPAFVAGVRLVLVVAKSQSKFSDCRCNYDVRLVGSTASELPRLVCKERSRLRQLLGDVGNYLFVSRYRRQGI